MISRNVDPSKVYSWGTRSGALCYIGRVGYFSDRFYATLDGWVEDTLESITPVLETHVDNVFHTRKGLTFGLFIPACKIMSKDNSPKSWRPFKNFKECSEVLGVGVGSVITMRPKGMPNLRFTSVILSAGEGLEKEDLVEIGTGLHTLSSWFKNIEIWNANKWQPFGVEE